MSPGDIIGLLAFAEGFGVPKATQADIDAWHHALHQLDSDEARIAVIMHYRESADAVMPADIWSRCRVPETPAAPVPPIDPHRRPAGPEQWHRMWEDALAVAGMDCEERRAAVLSQPEIAARLREPPLEYKHPDQWNGFIPPELFDGERNGSPRREALVSILEDAVAASLAAGAGEDRET